VTAVGCAHYKLVVTATQTLSARPWHAVTWVAWAVAAAISTQLAPNPVYVVLVIAIAWLVVGEFGREGPYARAFPILIGVSVFFALLRVLLIALTTHGNSEVLFTTPSFTTPEFLGGFTVGGSTTSPVVAQAFAEGLVVVGIIAVFAAFNAVVAHYELVQAAPRAFYEISLIVLVALAFVPSTIEAVREVREADRARTGGRVVRRGRLIRQVMPVLERGLEKAVTLGESLDSRGFARGQSSASARGAGWAGAASLVALGGAFVALVAGRDTAAIVLGIAGSVGIVATVRNASRATGRIRYRPRRLTNRDRWCIAAVLATPLLLGTMSTIGDDSLTWSVSPMTWPSLHLFPILALVPLLAPIALRASRIQRADEHTPTFSARKSGESASLRATKEKGVAA
jgi:energy-coupling factor transport system permease protein